MYRAALDQPVLTAADGPAGLRIPLLFDSVSPLTVAALLTWVFYAPCPIYPSLIAFVGLRWLVIEVIAFTANNSGLLNGMLFK